MSRWNSLPKILMSSLFLLFLTASLYFPAVGRNLRLVSIVVGFLTLFLVPFGGFSQSKIVNKLYCKFNLTTFIKPLLLFSITAFIVSSIKGDSSLKMGLPKESICEIEGSLLLDSSFSSSGNFLVRLEVQRCKSIYGYSATASGIITAIGKEKALVSSGVKVRLTGELDDKLFYFDTLQVLERNWINDVREKLIEVLESRLFGFSYSVEKSFEEEKPSNSILLSLMLLLGRSEDFDFQLKENAISCGCAHVLALSGMHLSILAGLCTFVGTKASIFGKSAKQKRIIEAVFKGFAVILIACFVLVAGPRSSLIRAAIMYCLHFFSPKLRLWATFILQALLFPFSMPDLGCCYGYAAVIAIIFLNDLSYSPVSTFLWGAFKSVFSALWVSAIVLVFCAPIQLFSVGYWSPIAIVISPMASLLAGFSMTVGLLIIVLGRCALLLWLNDLIYEMFENLFAKCSSFPTASWQSYFVMVAFLVGIEIGLAVLRVSISKRTKRKREEVFCKNL